MERERRLKGRGGQGARSRVGVTSPLRLGWGGGQWVPAEKVPALSSRVRVLRMDQLTKQEAQSAAWESGGR